MQHFLGFKTLETSEDSAGIEPKTSSGSQARSFQFEGRDSQPSIAPAQSRSKLDPKATKERLMAPHVCKPDRAALLRVTYLPNAPNDASVSPPSASLKRDERAACQTEMSGWSGIEPRVNSKSRQRMQLWRRKPCVVSTQLDAPNISGIY